MINSAERKKINFFRKEAVFKFRKKSPHLFYKLAGIALSNGGSSKIIEFLDGSFFELYEAAEKIPIEFSIEITGYQFSEIEAKAIYYLFLDQFRPKFGINISPEFFEKKKKFHNLMDERILYAADKLQIVRSVMKNKLI
jgi:hypothetical protein